MRRDGFLHLSVIQPNTIRIIRDHIRSVLSEHRGSDLGLRTKPLHIRQIPSTDEENQILKSVLSHPAVIELPYQDGIRNLMRELVGDDIFVHPRKYLRVIYPEAATENSKTGVHQDVSGMNSAADTFTLWIPIANCSRLHGGLRVLKGSHRFGIIPVKSSATRSIEIGSDAYPPDLEWMSYDYKPGELVAFHGYTIHDGAPNRSQEIRISLEIRFQSARDPINELFLRPHYRVEQGGAPNLEWSFDPQARWPEANRIFSNSENLAAVTAATSYYLS